MSRIWKPMTSLRPCATPRRRSVSVSCHYVRWDEVPGRREQASPVVVRVLRTTGHDAVQVGDVLRLNALDAVILEHAAREERVVVAADTDFGGLLASQQAAKPSVVLFHRQAGRLPREQAALLSANLASVESDLRGSAIVVVEERRVRVRPLPISEHASGPST